MIACIKSLHFDRIERKIRRTYEQYHRPEYLGMDPLVTVRGFEDATDREIGGFIAAVLSYGRVETIIRNVSDLFRRMGCGPAEFVRATGYSAKRRLLAGFKHRFNDGDDMALLLQAIAGLVADNGSMESFFTAALDRPACGMRGALTLFSETVRRLAAAISSAVPESFAFLVPSPATGCACKRLNMFLRWMVRPDDGVDMGVWKSIPTAALVTPVDTHVATIARAEKITKRNTADWRMAEEITDYLRLIDPFDPVRFDFSLCRLGMIDIRKNAA
ncbi:MAG: TIGR02757 family protein [Chitinispirillaceae bacterium]|nr:TIGR02757 family protein [Chitinispirillaceae bacterium]